MIKKIGFSLLLIIITLIAYKGSFHVPFLFDDEHTLVKNVLVREWWNVPLLLFQTRPLVLLTFALNFAFCGLDPFGYHILNFIIHAFAGILLFLIIEKTLFLPRFKKKYEKSASLLGFIVALLWLIHPLQTQSVTYLSQRSEILAAFFILGTFYAALRGWQSVDRIRRWKILALIFCGLGMLSKETAVITPLLLLFYQRIFITPSLKSLFKKDFWFYLALSGTWLLLISSLTALLGNQPYSSAGFQLKDSSVFTYALTQPEVVLHYLKLVFWPYPLCFDYAWPLVSDFHGAFPALPVIGVLFLIGIIALRYAAAFGFLICAFFILLLPSSSFIPIADAAFEHRMYLPLAMVIILLVMICHSFYAHFASENSAVKRTKQGLAFIILSSLILVSLTGTQTRLQDYQSELQLWTDTVTQRPHNVRALHNLGIVYDRKGDIHKAIQVQQQAVAIDENHTQSWVSLATAYLKIKDFGRAELYFKKALMIDPESFRAYNNFANLYMHQGKFAEGIEHYQKAIEIFPFYYEAITNLGAAFVQLGQIDRAREQFEKALQINPYYGPARHNLNILKEHN